MKTVVTLIIAALMFCQNSFGKQEDDISFDKGDFLYEALGNDKLAGMKEELPVKICVVRDDNGLILSILLYTFFSRMFDLCCLL